MHPAQLQDPGLDDPAELMRTRRRPTRPRRQPGQAPVFVAPQPGMHRLAGHAPLLGHLAHRPSVGQHREYRLVLLLLHAQLLQHESSVKKQPKPPSSIYRSRVKQEPEPTCQG
jgi:hypothetical protein